MSRKGNGGAADERRRYYDDPDVQRQHENDVRALMQDPRFRRFAWHLVSTVCNVHGTTFTGNSQTFWEEGRRSVGVEMMLEIRGLDPLGWGKTVVEQVTEEARTLRERDARGVQFTEEK